MTWEKATRRISLGAPGPTWSQFLHEIESLVGGERFGVQLSGPSGGDAMTDRVGEVVSPGILAAIATAGPTRWNW